MISHELKAPAFVMAFLASFPFTAACAPTSGTPAEARAITKEAYICGYPMAAASSLSGQMDIPVSDGIPPGLGLWLAGVGHSPDSL